MMRISAEVNTLLNLLNEDIDKVLEEGKVRTSLGTIDLSTSKLAILNSDGLQPKLASDLGYGAFAVCDLEPYTPILLERELFNANSYDLYKKIDSLTAEQRKAYYNLHGHKRRETEDICAAIWRTNRFSARPGGSVFLVASRFNHACYQRDNVDYSFDKVKRCMVFVTKKKISAGSELFIRYGSDPQHLYATWGFRCTCGGCPGLSEAESKAIKPAPWIEECEW
ncbi:hypothetical protein ONZ43_g32 [Nemania bipapillata]|uniref:Uncharacterized protein n=1 Tax=Nemania bipapillata TaxID=110536 RepID=A0ACC2JA07_9PEZI|nr:hypothetical protein ONZ43_g32 [Nemania bipapillata]